MRRPFGLIPALFLICAMLIGCSSSAGEPSENASPSPETSPLARPPRGTGPVAGATPIVGALRVVPEVGPCAPFRLEGRQFPAGAPVVVYKWDGVDQLVLVAEATANAGGEFTTIIAGEVLGSCSPGSEHVLEVRLRDFVEDYGPWPHAVYQVEPPGPLTVEPSVARCSQPLKIEGTGFPAWAEVSLFLGRADPLSFGYAPIGRVRANDEGEISYTYGGSLICEQGKQAVYALVAGFNGRWKAEFEYTGN